MRKLMLALVAMLAFAGSAYAATTHTIVNGDTLWALASKYYGDGSLYTILMSVNGISNPRTIRSGTVIKIPDKTYMESLRNSGSTTQTQTQTKTQTQTTTGNTTKESVKEEEVTDEDVSFTNKLEKEIDSSKIKSVNVTASED